MRGDHSSRSAVTNALTRHTRTAMKKRIIMPFLFGLAPDGVYLARAVTLAAVRSYRTLSPFLILRSAYAEPQLSSFLSVALSLGSRQPGVTRHPAFLEPGLSSKALTPSRSPDPLTARLKLGFELWSSQPTKKPAPRHKTCPKMLMVNEGISPALLGLKVPLGEKRIWVTCASLGNVGS